MPERVKPGIFRPALTIDDAGGELRRDQATIDDVGEALDLADAIRKDELELAPGACEPPLSERVRNDLAEWNRALPGLRLGQAEHVKAIGTLLNGELLRLQNRRNLCDFVHTATPLECKRGRRW